MHPVIRQVTERIRHRSEQSRQQYIELMQLQAAQGRPRAVTVHRDCVDNNNSCGIG